MGCKLRNACSTILLAMAFTYPTSGLQYLTPKTQGPVQMQPGASLLDYLTKQQTFWNTGKNYSVSPNTTPQNSVLTALQKNPTAVVYHQGSTPKPVSATRSGTRTTTKAVAPKTTGRVAGATTTALSSDLAAALSRSQSEGRFEGITDPAQRAQAQLEYERSKQEQMGGINDIYNNTISGLDRLQALLTGGQGDYLSGVEASYNAQIPMLQAARDQAIQTNQNQVGQVRQDEANAISEAKRVANELFQRTDQRFGGGGSAGQFANQVVGRGLLSDINSTRTTTGTNINSLYQQAQKIEQNYNAQLQSIEQQKQAALADAKDVFNQRLAEIENARIAAGQNKGAMQLQALSELSNRANQINDYFLQVKTGLDNQVAQANLSLRQGIAEFQTQYGMPIDLQGLPTFTVSDLGISPQTYQQDQGLIQGQLIKKPTDQGL